MKAFIFENTPTHLTLVLMIAFIQMETGATASVPRDMGEEKDEPDFYETHCHWVECDREMGCNDELVKVISNPKCRLTCYWCTFHKVLIVWMHWKQFSKLNMIIVTTWHCSVIDRSHDYFIMPHTPLRATPFFSYFSRYLKHRSSIKCLTQYIKIPTFRGITS